MVSASNTHIGIGLLSNSRRNEASRRFSAVTSETVSDSMSPNAVAPSLRLRSVAVDFELTAIAARDDVAQPLDHFRRAQADCRRR